MQTEANDDITKASPQILCLMCKAPRKGDERLFMFGGNRPFMAKFEAKLVAFIGKERLSSLQDKYKTKQGRSYICKHCYRVVNKTFDNIRKIQKCVAVSVNRCTFQKEKSSNKDLEYSDSEQEKDLHVCSRKKKLPPVAERRAEKIASLHIVKINYKIPKILIRPIEFKLAKPHILCQEQCISPQTLECHKSPENFQTGIINLNNLSNHVRCISEKRQNCSNDKETDLQDLHFLGQMQSPLVNSNKRISVIPETGSKTNIDNKMIGDLPDSESKKILSEDNTTVSILQSPKSTELSIILANPLLMVKSPLPIKLADVKDDNVYICGQSGCDWIFTSKFFWENHIRHYHYYGKPHKCPFKDCNKYFPTQSKWKQHIRKHTGERPFICEECGKSFRGSQELRHHRGTHTVGKPYQCLKPTCYKSFKYISSMKRHLQFHEGDYPFPCLYPKCTKAFKNKYELKCHNRLHTGERPYKCKESGCGKSFRLPCEYTKHRRAHTGERPFKCTWHGCNAAYLTSGGLSSHKLSHSNDQHICCEFCGKTFKHKMSYRTHLKLHKEAPETLICPVPDCDMLFHGQHLKLLKRVQDSGEYRERLSSPVNEIKKKQNATNLRNVDPCRTNLCDSLICAEPVCRSSLESDQSCTKSSHYEASTNFCQINSNEANQDPCNNSSPRDHQAKPHLFPRGKMCKMCGLAFQHIQQLHLHVHSFHDQASVLNEQEKGSFVCKTEKCDSTFQDADELRIHIESHLANPPYRCNYKACRQTFLLEKVFNNHLLEHEKRKPYSCTFDGCKEAFSTQLKLLRHSKIHYGRFRCPIHGCGTLLQAINSARIHLFRHTGEKPYACTLCGMRFATCAQWIRHKRTHTGEKPYECEVCHNKFADGGNLKIHMRIHTGETPYRCSECGRSFASQAACKSHMKSHTGDHPFICPVENCGKAFKESASLKSHQNVHAKPCHLCSQCGKIYKFSINQHKCKVEEIKEFQTVSQQAQQIFQQSQPMLQPQKSSLLQYQQKLQQSPPPTLSQPRQSLQYSQLQPISVSEYVHTSVASQCVPSIAVQDPHNLNDASVSHSSPTAQYNINSTMMTEKDGPSSYTAEVSNTSRSDKVVYGSNDNAQIPEVDRNQLLSSPYFNYMILYDRSTQQ